MKQGSERLNTTKRKLKEMRDSVAARAARKIRYHYVVAFDKDEAEEQMKEVRKIFRRGDEIVFIVWD